MAEAEDVLVDAARHATSYAIDLWRRQRAADGDANGIALRDVRDRIGLYLQALLDARVAIRTAAIPPRRTLASRLFERADKRDRLRAACPATDGHAIYLPEFIGGEATRALADYRIAALRQTLRVIRRTALIYPFGASLVVQDLYLLSEATATDAALLNMLPGVTRMIGTSRRDALAARLADTRDDEPLRSIEAMYRAFLEGTWLTPAATPEASLAWARTHALQLPAGKRYTGLPADAVLGAVLPADAQATGLASAPDLPRGSQPPRSVRMARRPRARQAPGDEDDPNTGPWMVQTSQPSEHAEDPWGLQRPVDQQPDADLQGTAESVSNLETLRLLSTPGPVREVLTTDDELRSRGARAPVQNRQSTNVYRYPEWDHRITAYVERAAAVRVLEPREAPASTLDAVLARHRATLVSVKRRFEALRARRSALHAQPEGDELDIDAFVGAHGERRARVGRSDRLYIAHRPARRDFALMLVIDVSASTDAWCGGAQRIIDVEKEALIVVATALDALGVRFGIQAFSGYGPGDVRVLEVKSFEQRFDERLERRIVALEPDEFTRTGAALRHATASLMREATYRRLLLLLSDGKPNDCDRYEGRYGLEDTRQALAEARLQGIVPFCMAIDRHASPHMASLFGATYTILSDPQHLTRALLHWLRTVTSALA